ncbi:hypothetical protein [Paraburkholderia sp. GAS32]|uniref:hypothetical protein n=1 Tax=Paraburkholderia sp. GAS32 TaxID=3035129 RepID=UPI003D1BADF7
MSEADSQSGAAVGSAPGDQPGKIQRPPSKEELLFELIFGESKDILDAQKTVTEVLTQMFVTADAVREAMAESARRLETMSAENQRELVAAHRELTQTIRDFEAKAGDNLAVPIAVAVGRTVKHQSAKLAVVAGGAALVGSLVGAGVVALLLR